MKSKEPVVLVEASFSGDPALTAACRKIARETVAASKTRVRWLDPGCRVAHFVLHRTEDHVEMRCGAKYPVHLVGPGGDWPDCSRCAEDVHDRGPEGVGYAEEES